MGLSNNTDNTTQTQRFDAWGTTLSGTIPQSAQYGYTGREPDETGLIYYRARYSDPAIGRFVARDPVGLQGGLNPYAYVGSNPVNLVDPLGLLPTDPIVLAQVMIPGVATDAATGVVGGAAGTPGYQGMKPPYQDVGGYQIVNGGLEPIPPSKQTFGDWLAEISSGGQRFLDIVIDISNAGFQTISQFVDTLTFAKPSTDFRPPTNPPQNPTIPEGWVSRPGTSGGVVWQPPGLRSSGPAIRIMPPDSQYPSGYWVQTNEGGQPINPSTGGTGPAEDTHVPLPPKGP